MPAGGRVSFSGYMERGEPSKCIPVTKTPVAAYVALIVCENPSSVNRFRVGKVLWAVFFICHS